MVRRIVVASIVLVLLAAFVAWRAGKASIVPHYVLMFDRSESKTGPCASVGAATERLVTSSRSKQGTRLAVLATGESSLRPEPRWVWDGPFPEAQIVESRERRETERQRFVDDIVAACRQLPPASASPILVAVARGLEHLRAAGCSPGTSCALYGTTDGEENVEAQLRRALGSSSRSADAARPLLANDGIRVVLCGFAETLAGARRDVSPSRGSSARGVPRAERVRAVWTALFTDPSLVSIEPFCGSSDGVR